MYDKYNKILREKSKRIKIFFRNKFFITFFSFFKNLKFSALNALFSYFYFI